MGMGLAKTSKYVGICWVNNRNKWMAAIKIQGKAKFLGYFENEDDAYIARKKAEENPLFKNTHKKQIHTKQEIITLYKNGLKISEIAKMFDRSYDTIREHIGNNLNRNDSRRFCPIQKQNIINDYISGKTIKQLATEYKIPQQSIYTFLYESNIKVRQMCRKYFLKDVHFLKDINCEWKAYFLGLFAADGNMSSPNKHDYSTFSISLHHKDAYILEELAQHIYENFIITSEKRTNQRKLQISAREASEDLLSLGYTPKKSLTLLFPANIDKTLMHHFLRGYFDGDGWVTGKTSFGIISSYSFCESFKEFLESELNIKAYVHAAGKVARTLVHKKVYFKQLYEYLYKDATLFLARKKEGFEKRLTIR